MTVPPEFVTLHGVHAALAGHLVGWCRSLVGDQKDRTGLACDDRDRTESETRTGQLDRGQLLLPNHVRRKWHQRRLHLDAHRIEFVGEEVAPPLVVCAQPSGTDTVNSFVAGV